FAGVYFVERVLGRVVDVEVALRVGGEAGDGAALQQQRTDVGAARTFAERVDAVGLEEREPARGARVSVALRTADVEAARREAAAVGLDGEDVFFFFLLR